MALKDKNTGTPEFEMGDEDLGTAEEQAAAIKAKAQERLAAGAAKHADSQPKEEKAEPKTTAVATQGAKAGQIAARSAMINPLEPLKNAFTVQYDTLRALKVSAGNVLDQMSGKVLGDVVGLELLSYQDQWVISPGTDGDEGKEEVRYSDDGKATTAGEDCAEYLERLKAAGFPKAKMTKRTVIAGSIFEIGEKGRKNVPDMQDSLVQMSLAPTSKASFDRYMMDQAFKIGKGILEPAGAERVRIECVPQSKNGNDWTVAEFSRWVDRA